MSNNMAIYDSKYVYIFIIILDPSWVEQSQVELSWVELSQAESSWVKLSQSESS